MKAMLSGRANTPGSNLTLGHWKTLQAVTVGSRRFHACYFWRTSLEATYLNQKRVRLWNEWNHMLICGLPAEDVIRAAEKYRGAILKLPIYAFDQAGETLNMGLGHRREVARRWWTVE
jgi:hypothetical protein